MTAAVEWSFNPWRDHTGRAVAAAAFALGGCALVLSFGESFVLSLGLCIVIVAAFAPLLAPAECRVDEEGASRRGPLGRDLRRWEDVRRGVEVSAGFLLSPYARPHWLDPYRALLLPVPVRLRDHVAGAVREHLRGHGL